MGDSSRFASAGTRQDDDRTRNSLGRGTLLGVESVKNLLRFHPGILASPADGAAGTVRSFAPPR